MQTVPFHAGRLAAACCGGDMVVVASHRQWRRIQKRARRIDGQTLQVGRFDDVPGDIRAI